MFEKFFNKNEQKEKGKNVKITIKFMRHGERDSDGNLLDIGREITKNNASEIDASSYDAVKAIGSTAGPRSESGMARALETSDIYAKTLDPGGSFVTRAEELLSYEKLVSRSPYDHRKVYDQNLPENFDELTNEEKVMASKKANAAAIGYFESLKTPEAEIYRKELGGAEAVVVEHYAEVIKRLSNNSKVLITAGGHGGMLEYLLTQSLVAKNENGEKIEDWNMEKIGGDLKPSEAFNIDLLTDEKGELLEYKVSFDGPGRPNFPEMYLDKDKVRELAEFYLSLHKK